MAISAARGEDLPAAARRTWGASRCMHTSPDGVVEAPRTSPAACSGGEALLQSLSSLELREMSRALRQTAIAFAASSARVERHSKEFLCLCSLAAAAAASSKRDTAPPRSESAAIKTPADPLEAAAAPCRSSSSATAAAACLFSHLRKHLQQQQQLQQQQLQQQQVLQLHEGGPRAAALACNALARIAQRAAPRDAAAASHATTMRLTMTECVLALSRSRGAPWGGAPLSQMNEQDLSLLANAAAVAADCSDAAAAAAAAHLLRPLLADIVSVCCSCSPVSRAEEIGEKEALERQQQQPPPMLQSMTPQGLSLLLAALQRLQLPLQSLHARWLAERAVQMLRATQTQGTVAVPAPPKVAGAKAGSRESADASRGDVGDRCTAQQTTLLLHALHQHPSFPQPLVAAATAAAAALLRQHAAAFSVQGLLLCLRALSRGRRIDSDTFEALPRHVVQCCFSAAVGASAPASWHGALLLHAVQQLPCPASESREQPRRPLGGQNCVWTLLQPLLRQQHWSSPFGVAAYSPESEALKELTLRQLSQQQLPAAALLQVYAVLLHVALELPGGLPALPLGLLRAAVVLLQLADAALHKLLWGQQVQHQMQQQAQALDAAAEDALVQETLQELPQGEGVSSSLLHSAVLRCLEQLQKQQDWAVASETPAGPYVLDILLFHVSSIPGGAFAPAAAAAEPTRVAKTPYSACEKDAHQTHNALHTNRKPLAARA
ncbi:uncharacterized protein LOC113147345 [Cyclospora cayetanensis]|uniref:Uncharacterized protein LOC113147345 n=1 Tax=Cyclospora cayetanensis TaxID=88456 RepID=A0A6P6S0R6_9EIME|nr:uncharacterized protein LOC113147345 [Cyclospora cayetanensis]